MMSSRLRLAAVLWLSGFVAGIVFLARWSRMGASTVETSAPSPVPDDASTASVSTAQRTGGRVAGPMLTGAKADLLTVRQATRKVRRLVTSTISTPDTTIEA
jgi:hypothetical protein